MKTLTASDTFSAQRLLQLIKRTINLNFHNWTIGFLAVGGLIAAIWFVPILLPTEAWHGYNTYALTPAFMFFYIAGGLYLTSGLFDELHEAGTAQLGLTLPALASEKIASAWITGYLLYSIAAFVAFAILVPVIYFITLITVEADLTFSLYDILLNDIHSPLFGYLLYQGFFLFGAVYFRKLNFLKTIVLMIVLFILFSMGMGLYAFLAGTNLVINFSSLPLFVQYVTGFAFALLMIWLAWLQLINRQVA
jgi:hypothetical protein